MIATMLPNYNSIAILGGTLPSPAVLEKIDWTQKVIAVDGALINAIEHNIRTDYLVGDLDAVYASKLAIPSYIEVHHNPEQNNTDFEKCIEFIRKKNLGPTLVIGINGGEIDHVIGNIHIMVKHHQQDGEFFFLDSDGKGGVKLGMVLTKTRMFSCGMGKNTSIFPFPDAIISTTGLQYPLSNSHIHQYKGILCARNNTVSQTMEINIHQGMVLVVIDL